MFISSLAPTVWNLPRQGEGDTHSDGSLKLGMRDVLKRLVISDAA